MFTQAPPLFTWAQTCEAPKAESLILHVKKYKINVIMDPKTYADHKLFITWGGFLHLLYRCRTHESLKGVGPENVWALLEMTNWPWSDGHCKLLMTSWLHGGHLIIPNYVQNKLIEESKWLMSSLCGFELLNNVEENKCEKQIQRVIRWKLRTYLWKMDVKIVASKLKAECDLR
jgi:hypothetical protein